MVWWVGKLTIKSISAELSYASTETGLSLTKSFYSYPVLSPTPDIAKQAGAELG